MAGILMKQVIAHIDARTTVVCLHAAGVVVPVDEPFETLAGEFMEPPFHIHCRSIVSPWMPGMDTQMHNLAMAELQKRPLAERRLGPNGEVGGAIPGPVKTNLPTGPAINLSSRASDFRPMPLAGHTPLEHALSGAEAMVEIMRAFKPVTPDISASMSAYVSSWHTSINDALREGIELAEAPARVQTRVANLDRMFKLQEALEEPITLYRMAELKFYDGQPGTSWLEPGFMSTSLNPKVAAGFAGVGDEAVFLEIRIPKGAKVAGVNPITGEGALDAGEAEVLIARGAQFRVISSEMEKVPGAGIVRKMIVELIVGGS